MPESLFRKVWAVCGVDWAIHEGKYLFKVLLEIFVYIPPRININVTHIVPRHCSNCNLRLSASRKVTKWAHLNWIALLSRPNARDLKSSNLIMEPRLVQMSLCLSGYNGATWGQVVWGKSETRSICIIFPREGSCSGKIADTELAIPIIRKNRIRCLNVSSDIFKDMGPRLYESVLKLCWVAMLEQDGWSTKYQLQEISEIANSLQTAANCRCENANRTWTRILSDYWKFRMTQFTYRIPDESLPDRGDSMLP